MTHRHNDTQTHRHTDIQTRRHTDIQTHRHADTRTNRYTVTQTHGHTDTQTHRHTSTQTHRQTDTQTHRHTDTQTHRQAGPPPPATPCRRSGGGRHRPILGPAHPPLQPLRPRGTPEQGEEGGDGRGCQRRARAWCAPTAELCQQLTWRWQAALPTRRGIQRAASDSATIVRSHTTPPAPSAAAATPATSTPPWAKAPGDA